MLARAGAIAVSTACDAVSDHWTSVIARMTGCVRATRRIRSRIARSRSLRRVSPESGGRVSPYPKAASTSLVVSGSRPGRVSVIVRCAISVGALAPIARARRRRSAIAPYARCESYGEQRARATRAPSARGSANTSSTRRVLPRPASPTIEMVRPLPASASSNAPTSWATSASRPTSGARRREGADAASSRRSRHATRGAVFPFAATGGCGS